MRQKTHYQMGFSLVEVIVASALMLIVFTGLFASISFVLDLISNSQAKLSALSLATARIEYIRSLPYESVGTIAGLPSGNIPQNSTTTLNGFIFSERVLIQNIDAPEDGLIPADINNFFDHKQVKVEYTWQIGLSTPRSLSLISTIVPRSIETSGGGGTIRVRVENYASTPLSGATVRLVNTTTTSTIDISRLTDATGHAFFAGAPAASSYEVYVSRPGYSSDQTYTPSAAIPISKFPPFTLLESDITDVAFSIDELSDLTIRAFSSFVEASSTERFTASTSIATTSTNVEVVAGELVLLGSAGVYETSGTAELSLFTPSALGRWGGLYLDTTLPNDTAYTVQFYAGTDAGTLLPNSDLPGNSSGLSGPYISLRNLDPAVYPSLRYTITLTTGDTSVTPQIDFASLWYAETAIPRANQALTITGIKEIGQQGDGTIIPKFATTTDTDSDGILTLANIEWDAYRLSADALDIAMICQNNPTTVAPKTKNFVDALLVPNSSLTARVHVTSGGTPLPGATVEVRRPGYSETQVTGVCGQVFFTTGLIIADDYEVEVSAPGFSSTVLSAQSIAGDLVLNVTL